MVDFGGKHFLTFRTMVTYKTRGSKTWLSEGHIWHSISCHHLVREVFKPNQQ